MFSGAAMLAIPIRQGVHLVRKQTEAEDRRQRRVNVHAVLRSWSRVLHVGRRRRALTFAEPMAQVLVHQGGHRYKYNDNDDILYVVLDPRDMLTIIGILDWEMATIGDPLMDLGNSVAYWIEKGDPQETHLMRMMPTHLEGMLTRRELVDRYTEKTGMGIANFDFYYCFGLFRLAVIAQQIYYRYYHGQSKDQRFAMFIFGVKILEEAALRAIEKSTL